MTTITCKFENNIIHINDYKNFMNGKIFCKCCNKKLIAKKGNILIHHFSHISNSNCFYSKLNKGPWHKMWQDLCNNNNIEYIFEK